MNATPAETSLNATAPELARRIGAVLALLAALVARGLLRQPKYAALIVPLWHRLQRIAGRVERAMTRPRPPGAARDPGRSRARGRPATAPATPSASAPRIPRQRGWLRAALGPDASAYASQLMYLLDQPEYQAAMVTYPGIARILRPVLWMLGPELIAPVAPGSPAPPPPRPWPKPVRASTPTGSGFDWAAALRGPEKSGAR